MRNSKITMIADTFLIIFSVIMFICAILGNKFIVNINVLFFKVFQNGEDNPLEEIKIVKWRCPEDYKTLFNFSYPGAVGGCYINQLEGISSTQCDNLTKSTGTKFKTFHTISKKNLYAWENVTLCVKEYNISNVNRLIVDKDSQCPENYTNCGYSDILMDKLCLQNKYDHKETTCPINLMQIVSFSKAEKFPHATKVYLTHDKILIYSNLSNAESFLPLNIKVEENFPCIVDGCFSNKSIQFPFPYDKDLLNKYGCNIQNRSEINRDLIDRRYIVLDSMKADDFYQNNDLSQVNDLPDNFEYYKRNANLTYYLYFRSYIRLSARCFTTEEIETLYVLLKLGKFYQLILLTVDTGNLILLAVLISLLGMLKIDSEIRSIVLSGIKLIMSYGFVGATAYLCITSTKISTAVNSKNIVYSSECWDEVTFHAFTNVYKVPDYLEKWEMLNYILLFMIIPYLLFLLLETGKYFYKLFVRACNKKSYRQNNLL